MKTKKNLLVLLCTLFILFTLSGNVVAQNYNNIINYQASGTPTYGAKIKTKIPCIEPKMPYLHIEGYDYNKSATINISLAFYVGGNGFFFTASSAGGSTPDIWISNEDGFVSIFIDDMQPFRRFTVSAFAEGMTAEPSQYQNWTVVEEPKAGLYQAKAKYINTFKERIGINTENPVYELDVNGTIRAKEVRVETGWADFVFKDDYKLPTLSEVKAHIDEHKHLPGMPSEAEVKENGVGLSEISTKLLQKVEELTLYMIQQNEQMEKQNEQIEKQNKEIENLKQQLKSKN